jgi:hypothetical protein
LHDGDDVVGYGQLERTGDGFVKLKVTSGPEGVALLSEALQEVGV